MDLSGVAMVTRDGTVRKRTPVRLGAGRFDPWRKMDV